MMEQTGGRGTTEQALAGHAYAAAGNAFVLIDGLRDPLPRQPAQLARSLVNLESDAGPGFRPDGLLLLTPTTDETAFGMVLYNLDGSRPEACGNGLRCLGQHALATGLLQPGSHGIATDAGPRRVRLEGSARDRIEVAALAAHPRILDREPPSAGASQVLAAVHADCGNPHLVLFVPDVSRLDLDAVGRAVQHEARFPDGVNVEVVRADRNELEARVYERGVGQTGSCGTGACAVAFAARALGFTSDRHVRVRFPGGELEVELDPNGAAWLSGSIQSFGSITL